MDASNPTVGSKDRILHILLAGAAASLPFVLYSQFLNGDAILYPFDSGLSHYPRFKIFCNALQEEGVFPLWQTIAYGGGPFHANPEVPSLYPPVLLLCAFLRPLWAMNLTMLLHLSAALVGMYALVVRLWRRVGGAPELCSAGALCGALFFGLNHFTRMEHFELVTYGAAHALIPWIFLAADGLLNGPRPARAAGVLGLLLGMQVFTGGLYVYAYTWPVVGTWFLFLGLLGGKQARRRTLVFGSLAALVAVMISLAKILPFLAWVPTTNRTGPLDPEVALRITLASFSGPEGFSWKLLWQNLGLYTGKGVFLVFAPFAFFRFRSGVVRMAAFMVIAGFAVALGPPYELLYRWVPPFDRIRFPFRAWTLANAFLPVLIGLGMNRFLTFCTARLPGIAKRRMSAVLFGLPAASILLWLIHLGGNDWRNQYVENPHSLKEVIDRYPNWKKMARSAGREWRAVSLDVRGPVRCNEQLIAAALDVETLGGFFGDAWPQGLIRHAYPTRTADVRIRRLAILSVGFFTFTRELAEKQPVTERMEDAARTIFGMEGKINGEFINRNRQARPRAIIPTSTGAVFGDRESQAVYVMHNAPAFKMDRIGFLSFGPGERPTEEELSDIQEIIVIEREETTTPRFREFLRSAERTGCRITGVKPPLRKEQNDRLREVVARLDALSTDPPSKAAFERTTSREVRVTREKSDQGGFVILSETWSLYGGWEARAGDREIPVRNADGAACAVHLRPGEGEFTSRYEPGEAYAGFWIGASGFLAALVLLLAETFKKGK